MSLYIYYNYLQIRLSYIWLFAYLVIYIFGYHRQVEGEGA